MNEMKKIPACRPVIYGNEKKYVNDCIDSSWISGNGPYCKKFEQMFAKYIGTKHAVSCTNGTVAIHLALLAAGIKPGDEVIVPALAPVFTVNPIFWAGARPVLVDVDKDTWNIDVTKIEEKITSKTKAILPIHLYGMPCDMETIVDIAESYGLAIIEDGAEAIGAEWNGKKVGSIGDVGTFSFYANKAVTCFPSGTKILIKPPKGIGKSRMKKIEDIDINDEVLSFNIETSGKEYDKVIQTFVRDVDEDLIKISFSNNNVLTATSKHPVFVVDKGWVRFKDVKVGDEVIQYKYRGNAYRELYKGKTYNKIMGKNVGDSKRFNHSEILKELHASGKSGYADKDYVAIGKKLSIIGKGRKFSQKVRRSMSRSQKKRWKSMSYDERQAFCERMKVSQSRPEVREKKRLIALKLYQNPEYRKKLSIGVRDAMRKKSYWNNYIKGMCMKPNKAEKKLEMLLNDLCLNEFAYNGDGRQKVIIDRLIPDFVNINKKKKIIDLLGKHWHERIEESQRIARYKKHGFDALMIWDYELDDENVLKEKIKTFIFNPNVKLVKVVKIENISYSGKVYNIETSKNHNYFSYGILVHNCGEGGMIATDDDDIAKEARYLRNQARSGTTHFIHEKIGYNYRLADILAAFGCGQMEHVEESVASRIRNAELYTKYLSQIKGITLPPKSLNTKNVYWMYTILVGKSSFKRDAVITALAAKGIETRAIFYPIHTQPAYGDYFVGERYPVAENISVRGLNLPSSNDLSEDEIKYICDCLKELVEK